jgi:hypothetical protein
MSQEDTGLPPFSSSDWIYLSQVHSVLSKFSEFTLTVSKSKPQLSLSVAIYYELDDFFRDAEAKENLFKDIDESIRVAVCAGLGKYKKYYTFIDTMDVYYIAMILDPRIKCELLKQELDKEGAHEVIEQMRAFLHQHYPRNCWIYGWK